VRKTLKEFKQLQQNLIGKTFEEGLKEFGEFSEEKKEELRGLFRRLAPPGVDTEDDKVVFELALHFAKVHNSCVDAHTRFKSLLPLTNEDYEAWVEGLAGPEGLAAPNSLDFATLNDTIQQLLDAMNLSVTEANKELFEDWLKCVLGTLKVNPS
jgi:hypothetical protein